jgi:glycosyltransferase involved in cell wall biosynthesis
MKAGMATRMSKLKVVHILSRLNIGGTASHVILATRGLRDRGVEALLITGREDPREGNMFSLAEAKNVQPILIPSLRRAISPLRDLAAGYQIWKILRREKPQIVHTHASKAGVLGRIAALLAGVPVRIHTFHGHVLQDYFHPHVSRIFIWIERALARRSDAIIGVSSEVCSQLIDMGIAESDKVRHIGIGLELEPFADCDRERGKLKAELGIPNDIPVVGMIARLAPVKGYEVFFQATARLTQQMNGRVRFLVIGDGPLRHSLEAQVRDMGLGQAVIFTGFREDLVRIYADLDVVALSSHNEGTPVTLIEAAAAGRPGVATRVGGVPELIEDGVNGFLVEKGDWQALADRMAWLLAHPEEARRMGQSGRQRVLEAFSVQRLIDDLVRLYRELSKTDLA